MNTTIPVFACPASPSNRCEFGPARSFRDRSGKVGATAVVQCLYCGHGITHPPLSDVAFLYEDRTSQDFQSQATGISRTIKHVVFKREARRLLRQIGDAPSRVLDYGCGSGLFTRCLDDVLAKALVVGSDFHNRPPRELLDRPYVPNDELSPANAFDLVIAMHVIEHDDNPASLIQRIAAFGKSGSRVVFEVPNVNCVWAEVFGPAWDNWYIPYHRVHFSRSSLRSAIESAGLIVDQELNATVPSMGRTLANVFGRSNSLSFLLAGAILHPVQWLVERITGRPSALRVIARKR